MPVAHRCKPQSDFRWFWLATALDGKADYGHSISTQIVIAIVAVVPMKSMITTVSNTRSKVLVCMWEPFRTELRFEDRGPQASEMLDP